MGNLALATLVLAMWSVRVSAMQAGTSQGKVSVSPQVMAGRCITIVSPNYPQIAGSLSEASFVVVRVVVSKTGSVSPLRAISGPPSLQDEAMDAVRLWRYKPFLREGEPLDVTTDVRVDFNPGKPGGIVSHPNH